MVLGLLGGSMPMLISLLMMQGITLTMWRSFLDRAIPKLEPGGDRLRKSLETLFISQQANMATTSTTTQAPVLPPSLPSSLQSSPPSSNHVDDHNPLRTDTSPSKLTVPNDPVSLTRTLELLSKIDPSVLKMFAQLTGQQQQSTPPPPPIVSQLLSADSPPPTEYEDQPPPQYFDPNQLSEDQAQLNSPAYNYAPQTTQEEQPPPPPGQQLQYVHYPSGESQEDDQVKYIEVSSGNMAQAPPNYEQQAPVQYVYQTDTPETSKYEYEQPQTEMVEQTPEQQEETPSEDQQEEQPNQVELEASAEPDSSSTSEASEEVAVNLVRVAKVHKPKKAQEDKRPAVIIGPPQIVNKHRRLKAKHNPRLSKKRKKRKRLQRERYLRFLRKQAKRSKMFGEPLVRRKRMLFFKDFYGKKRDKQRSRKQDKTSISQRKRKYNLEMQARKNPSGRHPGFGGPFRFATPPYPLVLLPQKAPKAVSMHHKPSKFYPRTATDEQLAESQNIVFRANESVHRATLDMNKVNQTSIRLKSKKIELFDLNSMGADVNCTVAESNKSGRMKTLWTSKNGQVSTNNKCIEPIKFVAGNNIELNLAPKRKPHNESKNTENETSTKLSRLENQTTTPASSTTTQTETPETTTTRPIESTALPSPSTSKPIDKFDANTFLMGLNNLFKNLATSTPAPTTTTPASITSTQTMLTETQNIPPDLVDRLPKELMLHILKAINMSKIDNFQVGSAALKKPKTVVKKTEEEDEEEDANGDEEEEVNVPGKDVSNVVDGIMPVAHRFKRVCYFLLDGGRQGQLDIHRLEMHICSHLIVGYARLSTTGLVVVERPLEDTEKYRRLTQLKTVHPHLKVLLSVGDLGGTSFSLVASSNRTRDRFVSSVLDFCNEFNFDGVDIDWEFPSFRTGFREDKLNFILLLSDLRAKSSKMWRRMRLREGGKTRNDGFIISVAVGAPLVIASTSYTIPALARVVDFVNLMSYDFHYYRADRPYTGHHSPLYPRGDEKAYYSTLNVAWAATYWANSGMPLAKIVVGIPTYARTFNLVVPIGQHMFNVPATGPGLGRGKLNYTGVCEFLRQEDTHKEFEMHTQVPYAYRGFDWIAYENEISVAIKTEWIIKTGMGGVVTFALNFDDTLGTCRVDGKRFPLQKTISNLLELASIKSYKENAFITRFRSDFAR